MKPIRCTLWQIIRKAIKVAGLMKNFKGSCLLIMKISTTMADANQGDCPSDLAIIIA